MRVQHFLGVLVLVFLPFTGFAQGTQLADSLHSRGIEFYELGNYRQSEFYLEEAYKLYKKSAAIDVWLKPGIDYAEILVSRSKYEKAVALFNKLKKTATASDHTHALVQIENDLGWVYGKMGDNNRALQHYKKALPLAKQVKDTLRLGYIYDNLGGIYRAQGNYEKSLEYRKQSLSYLEQLDQPRDISITLNNIGRVYEDLSLYNKAFEYYRRSLAIRKKLGDVYLLSSVYNFIASLHKTLGDYDQALINFNKSLTFSKKTGNPSQTAATLNNIGTLYNLLGQPERALNYYKQSLELKSPFAGPGSMATAYKNIANRLWDLGRHEEAINYYQKALNLRRQAGNPHMIAESFLDLARVEKSRQQISQSINYLQQARGIADSTQDRSLQREISSLWGSLEFARDNYSKAIAYYKDALGYTHSHEKNTRLVPLKQLAHTYDAINSDSTLHYSQSAINLIEEMRSQTGPLSQIKAGYFKRHADFYIDRASWLLKYKNDASEAYRMIESAKARAHTEELAQAAQRVDESLPEDERIKRARKLAHISSLYTRLNQTSDSEKEKKLKAQIRDKELEYASFENNLQEDYREYKFFERPKPIALDKVQTMCDTNTAVLEYAVTSDKLLIFFVTQNDVQTKQFLIKGTGSASAKHPPLKNQVMQFREAILSRASEDSIQSLSRPIYDQLIAPFHDQLAAYENIIIIPDKFLAYLPFDALQNNNNYLVSQFNIKYAPSMTGFSLISEPRQDKPQKLLAIGNSDQYASGSGLATLPSADLEIKSIAKLFNEPTTLNNEHITEENIKARIQDHYSFIHIAAHSVIDEETSSQSGIILNRHRPENGIGNDGFLRSSEIYRLNIPGDMIVLSACKSGIGQVINGEGILGLQRAFFTAGASTVIVSLWDVYDRPTTKLMSLFYKSFLEKNGNGSWADTWQGFLRWTGWDESVPFGHSTSALRDAKLAMLDHPQYRHPVYWAPFIAVGR